MTNEQLYKEMKSFHEQLSSGEEEEEEKVRCPVGPGRISSREWRI